MAAGAPALAVVEHAAKCPPARLDEWWAATPATTTVHRPYLGDPLPERGTYDGIVVLGGPMGATDEAEHWWLAPLKQLLREDVAAGVPVLGVCLGHQVLADALGGTVQVNPRGQAVGLTGIGWTDRAGDDPVLGACVVPGARAVQWNDDVVSELPAGAVALARTPAGDLQAARFAARAWGVQFHPEADRALVELWAVSDAERHRARGIDQGEVLAAIDAAHAELGRTWRPLAQGFVEQVAAAAERVAG